MEARIGERGELRVRARGKRKSDKSSRLEEIKKRGNESRLAVL